MNLKHSQNSIMPVVRLEQPRAVHNLLPYPWRNWRGESAGEIVWKIGLRRRIGYSI